MKDTIIRYLAGVDSGKDRAALTTILSAIGDRLNCQVHNSGALAIKAGGGVLAKTGSTFYATVQGRYSATTTVDMPSLLGLNITAAYFNVAVFYIDSAAAITVGFGSEGATAAAVKFPQTPAGKAIIGYLMITHSSAFTGNTTALDTATTVYVNTPGAFDPTIFVS